MQLENLRIMEGLIFDEVTGKFHRVSDTAGFIIGLMQQKVPMDDMIVSYAERYDVPLTTAARDIELFLNDLLEKTDDA